MQNAVVLVTRNRIGECNSVTIPDGVKTLDVNGMTSCRDCGNHTRICTISAKATRRHFPRFDNGGCRQNKAGITTLRDTGGPIHEQLALRADIEAGRLPGPRLFLAGPVLHQHNPVITATSNIEYLIGSPAEAREVTEKVINLGVDQIKVARFWDFDILKAIVDTAHKAGLGVEADVRHMNAYSHRDRSRR